MDRRAFWLIFGITFLSLSLIGLTMMAALLINHFEVRDGRGGDEEAFASFYNENRTKLGR